MKRERLPMVSKYKPRQQRIRLFESRGLERLTLFSPRAFALMWIIILSLALWMSWGRVSLSLSVTYVLLGTLGWTLFEYCMHRFIFHLKPKSEFGRWVIFLVHGNHHRAPVDSDRNLMPPVVSLPVFGVSWCLFLLLFGGVGWLVFLGFAAGYVMYDSVHYACHQFTMRGPLLRYLQDHHTRHHYARRDGNYAITAIFWDRLFRTSIPGKTADAVSSQQPY